MNFAIRLGEDEGAHSIYWSDTVITNWVRADTSQVTVWSLPDTPTKIVDFFLHGPCNAKGGRIYSPWLCMRSGRGIHHLQTKDQLKERLGIKDEELIRAMSAETSRPLPIVAKVDFVGIPPFLPECSRTQEETS